MLVLTRKKNERIIIDDKIEICVVGIKGNRVLLGIQAPREVSVQRAERVAVEAERTEQGHEGG